MCTIGTLISNDVGKQTKKSSVKRRIAALNSFDWSQNCDVNTYYFFSGKILLIRFYMHCQFERKSLLSIQLFPPGKSFKAMQLLVYFVLPISL